MDKKFRNINVNGQQFAWSPGRNNCDGDWSNKLKIWKDKKLIHEELIPGHTQLTPSFVKNVIEKLPA